PPPSSRPSTGSPTWTARVRTCGPTAARPRKGAPSTPPTTASARMRRVAVFGNAGGGKSTLARRLAALTGLPLHVIDMLQFRVGAAPAPHAEYVAPHAALIARDEWIIDGFASVPPAGERFAAADTLIHVDLPLLTHYRWVTKRFVKGLFASPPGWP